MRYFFGIALVLLALGAAGATSKTAPKKKAAIVAKKSTAAKKTAAKRVVARRRTQQLPTPERYTEIQTALIGRGLLQAPATGVWGPESAAALKSFQTSQKLEPTGKINALSLIRLGLGPKRQTASLPPSAP